MAEVVGVEEVEAGVAEAGAEAPAGAVEEAEAGVVAEVEVAEAPARGVEEVAAGAETPAGAAEAATQGVPAGEEGAGAAGQAPALREAVRSAGRWKDRSCRRAAAAGRGRYGPCRACARRCGDAGRGRRWFARGSAPGAPRARSSDRRPRQPRCPLPGCACLLPETRLWLRLRRGSRASGRRRPQCPRPRRGSAARSSARDPARAAARSRAARAGTAVRARREAPVAGQADQVVFAAFGCA